MLKASLFTLGCKLNQYETNYIAHIFEQMGYNIVPFPAQADVYLINTCTVTAKSESHSRQAVRRGIRQNPDGIMVVTGCAAQVDPQAFGRIPGVDLVIGNMEKASVANFLNVLQKGEGPRIKVGDYGKGKPPLFPMAIQRFSDYTRAFIKVQEGCDACCSYCIVPKARGPARSTPLEDVVAQAHGLWAAGYRELVLSGIHLGQYGKDMHPKKGLCDLVDRLLVDIGGNRLRLSSIEPNEVNQALLDCIGSSGRLCPHFHIPLQSGSQNILGRMNRNYTSEAYTDVIYSIIRRSPIASIGTDVMIGFPGETDQDFAKTYELLEGLPLAYLHVFSFSPRPGTPAALMPHQVSATEKRCRSLSLRKLGQRKKGAFHYRFLGKELEGLILNRSGPKPGYKVALTGNYIPVFVEANPDKLNRLSLVKIEKVTKEGTWGRITAILK